MDSQETEQPSSASVLTPPPQQELEVQLFLEHWTDAIRRGDLEKIISFYSDDIVGYDMMPPLEFRGVDRYRDSWQHNFTEYFEFPVEFEFHKREIIVSNDIAYSFGVIRMTGMSRDREKMECWLRNTVCLKKFAGKWQIIHEHNSVPIDPETDKALLNLEPVEPIGQNADIQPPGPVH